MKDFGMSKRTPKRNLAISAILTVAFLVFLSWMLVLVLSPSSSNTTNQSNTRIGGSGTTQQSNKITGSPATGSGPWEAVSAVGTLGTGIAAVISGIVVVGSRNGNAEVKVRSYQRPTA